RPHEDASRGGQELPPGHTDPALPLRCRARLADREPALGLVRAGLEAMADGQLDVGSSAVASHFMNGSYVACRLQRVGTPLVSSTVVRPRSSSRIGRTSKMTKGWSRAAVRVNASCWRVAGWKRSNQRSRLWTSSRAQAGAASAARPR